MLCGLFVRLFCCYFVVILIALQSINAIATSTDHSSHQNVSQSVNSSLHQQKITENHQDRDHHSEAELLAFKTQSLDGEPIHSDADHPECHANHCHHSNLIYLNLSSQLYLSHTIDKQVINKAVLFNSLSISTDSRPPIV